MTTQQDTKQVVVFERGTWIAPTDVPESELFRGLGIAIASDHAALASLHAAGRVTDVIPLNPTSTSDLKIARALDLVAAIITFGQNQGAPSDFVVGGRSADRPGYPTLDRESGKIIASEDALETEPALFAVVNMSFEPPSALAPVRAGDIVQIATWALSRAAVIIAAAGNRGRLLAHESVSAWSEVPWVIGVGSMKDEAGTTLSARSSRGTPSHPNSGPDCVAYGASRLNPSMIATSFAAPRVAEVAALCVGAILQLQRVASAAAGQRKGVRLVGVAVVDKDFDSEDWIPGPPRLPLDALPTIGPTSAAAVLFEALESAGQDPRFVGSPEQARALVLGSARALPAFGRHEVGAGLVSMEIAISWLSKVTGEDWLRLFGRSQELPLVDPKIRSQPLFDEAGLRDLARIMTASMPIFACDRDTHHFRFRRTKEGEIDDE